MPAHATHAQELGDGGTRRHNNEGGALAGLAAWREKSGRGSPIGGEFRKRPGGTKRLVQLRVGSLLAGFAGASYAAELLGEGRHGSIGVREQLRQLIVDAANPTREVLHEVVEEA